MPPALTEAEEHLERLIGYLATDPDNLSLLSDAAEAALALRRPDIARDMLDRFAKISPTGPRESNLAGLAALQAHDYEDAAARFAEALVAHPDDPSVRFNLAYALAMLKRFEESLAALGDEAGVVLPQAAMLHIQLLHELARFEDAIGPARVYIERHPDHQGLMAAVSVLALDVEDLELARMAADRGGEHPDALTTLGTLALTDTRDADAGALFDRAIAINKDAPRAWIGKGLISLAQGAHEEAALSLERGATLFGDHIGSWIALGWAHLLHNRADAARVAFEHALSLDDTFADTHGSLAVLNAIEGRWDDARRETEIARRLDRRSFSAALAQAVLFNAENKSDVARAIIERTLHTPLGPSGATIAQALMKRALLA